MKKNKLVISKKRGRPRKRLIKEIEKANKTEDTPFSATNSDIKKEGISCKLRSRREE